MRYRQFAAAPRGGLLLARGSRNPTADGEPRSAKRNLYDRSKNNSVARNVRFSTVVFSPRHSPNKSGSALGLSKALDDTMANGKSYECARLL